MTAWRRRGLGHAAGLLQSDLIREVARNQAFFVFRPAPKGSQRKCDGQVNHRNSNTGSMNFHGMASTGVLALGMSLWRDHVDKRGFIASAKARGSTLKTLSGRPAAAQT